MGSDEQKTAKDTSKELDGSKLGIEMYTFLRLSYGFRIILADFRGFH
jgi:hypothetical protein